MSVRPVKRDVGCLNKEEYITFLIKTNSFFQEEKDKPQREKIRNLCDYLCLEGVDDSFLFAFQELCLELKESLKEELTTLSPYL